MSIHHPLLPNFEEDEHQQMGGNKKGSLARKLSTALDFINGGGHLRHTQQEDNLQLHVPMSNINGMFINSEQPIPINSLHLHHHHHLNSNHHHLNNGLFANHTHNNSIPISSFQQMQSSQGGGVQTQQLVDYDQQSLRQQQLGEGEGQNQQQLQQDDQMQNQNDGAACGENLSQNSPLKKVRRKRKLKNNSETTNNIIIKHEDNTEQITQSQSYDQGDQNGQSQKQCLINSIDESENKNDKSPRNPRSHSHLHTPASDMDIEMDASTMDKTPVQKKKIKRFINGNGGLSDIAQILQTSAQDEFERKVNQAIAEKHKILSSMESNNNSNNNNNLNNTTTNNNNSQNQNQEGMSSEMQQLMSPETLQNKIKLPAYHKTKVGKIKEENLEGYDQYESTESDKGKRVYTKRTEEKVRRWSPEETMLYERFIEMYLDVIRDASNKRNKKIFLLMSKFIGTKTPAQCRSHHQKFFKKIIRALTNDPTLDTTLRKLGETLEKEGIERVQQRRKRLLIKNQQRMAINNSPKLECDQMSQNISTHSNGVEQYQESYKNILKDFPDNENDIINLREALLADNNMTMANMNINSKETTQQAHHPHQHHQQQHHSTQSLHHPLQHQHEHSPSRSDGHQSHSMHNNLSSLVDDISHQMHSNDPSDPHQTQMNSISALNNRQNQHVNHHHQQHLTQKSEFDSINAEQQNSLLTVPPYHHQMKYCHHIDHIDNNNEPLTQMSIDNVNQHFSNLANAIQSAQQIQSAQGQHSEFNLPNNNANHSNINRRKRSYSFVSIINRDRAKSSAQDEFEWKVLQKKGPDAVNWTKMFTMQMNNHVEADLNTLLDDVVGLEQQNS